MFDWDFTLSFDIWDSTFDMSAKIYAGDICHSIRQIMSLFVMCRWCYLYTQEKKKQISHLVFIFFVDCSIFWVGLVPKGTDPSFFLRCNGVTV